MSGKVAIYFDGGFICKILRSFLHKNIGVSDLEKVLDLNMSISGQTIHIKGKCLSTNR